MLPLLLLCCLAIPGCSRSRAAGVRAAPSSYYQTGPAAGDVSGDIEQILRAVKRLHITGLYVSYRFALADSITDDELSDPATWGRATSRYTFSHTKAGTAVVIAAGQAAATLITNDHITRLPDTLVVHHGDAARAGSPARYVESVTVLTGRSEYVLEMPGSPAFRVIARDTVADLALLRVPVPADARIDVLRAPPGNAARLTWASFVYVLGFPGGQRMVTRAIISQPSEGSNSFLLDGLFNRGMSGGLILAVRSDTGALEWVGLARAASAETEYLLFPENRDLQEEGMLLPYSGNLYLERAARIQYGITFCVSIDTIEGFLRRADVRAGRY